MLTARHVPAEAPSPHPAPTDLHSGHARRARGDGRRGGEPGRWRLSSAPRRTPTRTRTSASTSVQGSRTRPHKPGKQHQPGKPGKPGEAEGRKTRGTRTTRRRPTAGPRCPATRGCRSSSSSRPAQPITPYQMPFPCGEMWSGSTRGGHSPSVRAVDFNYPGGDHGKAVVAAAPGTVVTSVVGKKKPSYGQYVVSTTATARARSTRTSTRCWSPSARSSSRHPARHRRRDRQRQRSAPALRGAARRRVVDAWFHGSRFPMNSSAGLAELRPVAVTDIPLAGDMYGGRSAEVMVYRSRPRPLPRDPDRHKERVIKIGDGAASRCSATGTATAGSTRASASPPAGCHPPGEGSRPRSSSARG